MRRLSIHLLGKFCVQQDDQTAAGFEASKVQELFCYLLLHRARPHPRETLASLLWSEQPSMQSKKYLRQTLWQLQGALDAAAEPDQENVLMVLPDWIQFNPAASLWLDVSIFEQAFALAQGIPGQKLDARRAQALQEAVDLYQGDLLEGWYQEWCLYERERLQRLYLTMLDKLMGYCEARGSYEAGLEYGARILRYDRARECTHQALMRLHYLAGDRAAALHQYERCVVALEEELGVKPARRTLALYQQLRADQLDDAPPTAHFNSVAHAFQKLTSINGTGRLAPDVLDLLAQLQSLLAELLHRLEDGSLSDPSLLE